MHISQCGSSNALWDVYDIWRSDKSARMCCARKDLFLQPIPHVITGV